MRLHIIYLITNLVNGKTYVGQTIYPIRTRWQHHVYSSRKPRTAIGTAIKKYGSGSFRIRELEKVNLVSDLNAREIFYITKMRSHVSEHGYNLTRGGMSAPTRESVSKSLDGHPVSQSTRDKLAKAATGKFRKIIPEKILTTRAECKRGHPLTGENVYVRSDGYVKCLQCANAAVKLYKARTQKFYSSTPSLVQGPSQSFGLID